MINNFLVDLYNINSILIQKTREINFSEEAIIYNLSTEAKW